MKARALDADTAIFAGMTGSSLATAAQFLPAPAGSIIAALIPIMMAGLLWYFPFLRIRLQIRAYLRLSGRIEYQLAIVRLSPEDRTQLLMALEEANRRVIELQFALYPTPSKEQETKLTKSKELSERIRSGWREEVLSLRVGTWRPGGGAPTPKKLAENVEPVKSKFQALEGGDA